ncbi:hypothetical protein Klosneuvirus_3_129 [Klosneuvirus KNV1]|uniref:FkbM family methyltransferase n=1 Tax=Klosneuvirus KNV1 TaxID=1977640 RepID=A0A1V0SK46_9VIRU|nr:hypothetical protein Klosneuvirus_3_129 [Klosneuvirus KNV1]
MSLQIFYGVGNQYKDVTSQAFKRLSKTSQFINNKLLIIPSTDGARATIFGDPFFGSLKHILVVKNGISKLYDHTQNIIIDISDIDYSSYLSNKIDKVKLHSFVDPEEKLSYIHQHIFLENINIMHEYPEQVLSCRFLPSNAHVLEIGANVGRNTMVIGTILNDDRNLVTLECDQNTVNTLRHIRDINNYNFNIEDSALSKRKLIQKGWETIPSDEDLPGYTRVKTITFSELEAKYNITFDTLVADCEGALYYIFMDEPDMLNNIKLFLTENDYVNYTHKQKVDEILISKGFKRIYYEGGGWGPCANHFYEAWAKI